MGTALRLPKVARSALRAYERRLVSRAAAVVTVNDALAAVLRERYRPARIVAVHNCPDRWSPPAVTPTHLRDAAEIPKSAPVILYHGALSLNRGVEQLMDALLEPGLQDAHLILLGFGEMRNRYVDVAAESIWGGRVHVLDPVPPADLLSWVGVLRRRRDADPAIDAASSLVHAEQAVRVHCGRDPGRTSDFPSMRRIVLDDPAGPVGVVCEPSHPRSVAAALRSLLELDRSAADAYRARCRTVAQARWNWETQAAGLISLYEDLALGLR